MSAQIEFEQPPGVPHPSLEFSPGDTIRVRGDVGGLSLIPGLRVDLTLTDGFSPQTWTTETGFFGKFCIDITLPYVLTTADIRVDAYFAGLVDTTVVTIGIGMTPPPPPPPPKGILDQLKPWLIGAGVALVAMYAAPVLVPLGKEAVRSVKKATR